MTHPTNRAQAPTRRDFLAQTAAVTGAAAVISSLSGTPAQAAFKAPRAAGFTPVGPEEVIRMGVIGTGGMGTAHCDSICKLAAGGHEKVQIVALADVCDPRVENARSVCEQAQGIKVDTYRDYRQLLARKDIHCVLIASPEHWHADQAIDAIAAGKDVYLEKPMTLNLDDALRLRATCRNNPEAILQVGTQYMQLPKYHEARKMIAQGAIGKPVFSQTSYCRNSEKGEWLYYAIDPAWEPGKNLDWDAWCGPLGKAPWNPEIYARWRRYKKYSTGIIGDLLVHVMTPLMMALDQGWPVRVTAGGGHYIDKAMENHDQVNITVEFEKEHTMIVAGSTCNEVGLETLIRGHKGNIYLNARHCEMRPERIFVDKGVEPAKVECPDIGNDQDVHRLAWLKSVRTRQQPLANVELGTQIMVVVDLAARSMWDGHAYTFDPKTLKATRV